jgi:hypothetical protein
MLYSFELRVYLSNISLPYDRLILMVSLVRKFQITSTTSVDAAVHLGFSLQVSLSCEFTVYRFTTDTCHYPYLTTV